MSTTATGDPQQQEALLKCERPGRKAPWTEGRLPEAETRSGLPGETGYWSSASRVNGRACPSSDSKQAAAREAGEAAALAQTQVAVVNAKSVIRNSVFLSCKITEDLHVCGCCKKKKMALSGAGVV